MSAQTGQPDFVPDVDEEPVLYVVDEGPDGPAELLRLAPNSDTGHEKDQNSHNESASGSTMDNNPESESGSGETAEPARALPSRDAY